MDNLSDFFGKEWKSTSCRKKDINSGVHITQYCSPLQSKDGRLPGGGGFSSLKLSEIIVFILSTFNGG